MLECDPKMFQRIERTLNARFGNDSVIDPSQPNFYGQPFPMGDPVSSTLPFGKKQMKCVRAQINNRDVIFQIVVKSK